MVCLILSVGLFPTWLPIDERGWALEGRFIFLATEYRGGTPVNLVVNFNMPSGWSQFLSIHNFLFRNLEAEMPLVAKVYSHRTGKHAGSGRRLRN